MIHNMETWTIGEKHKNNLHVFEILGLTRKDKHCNVDVNTNTNTNNYINVRSKADK